MDVTRTLQMKLESFSKVYNENNIEDPTLIKATFIILEVDSVSGNDEIITKEEALKMSPTMALKPLVCQYTPTTNYIIPDDHFGSHGKVKDSFRKNGTEFITTNSFAIGVSKDGCYISTIEKDGQTVEVLKCDYYLWLTRYLNICSLMEDIYNSGTDLYSSCEYIYKAEDVDAIEGIKYPKNLIFEGHCLLGSRNDGSIVEPAFEVSKMTTFNEKWTSVLNETINKTLNNKEEKEMAFKKEDWITIVNELSHGDTQSMIYTSLSKIMTADEFYGVWISDYDIYDTYFIYSNYEGDAYIHYKVNYTKTDTEVTVDYVNKIAVKWTDLWVEVSESASAITDAVTNVETIMNEKIIEKDNSIKSLNDKITNLEGEKVSLNEKYTKASDTITSLNEKVTELQPIADNYNKDQYEKQLNEKQSYYKNKFTSLNAIDKFNSEEIQNLIVKSLNEIEAKEKLSDVLIELVPITNEIVKEKSNITIPSEAVKTLNSMADIEIPNEKEIKDDFDSQFTI